MTALLTYGIIGILSIGFIELKNLRTRYNRDEKK